MEINRNYIQVLMKKSRMGLICFSFLVCLQLYGQTDRVCFDIDNVEGVIFLKGGDVGLSGLALKRSLTNVQEVLKIDSLVKLFIDSQSVEKGLVQQGFDGCPVISKAWKDYYRQVIKYEDEESGHQIIWIQYVHKSQVDINPNWKENWVIVFGGCSYYWRVKYDIDSQRFFSFVIN